MDTYFLKTKLFVFFILAVAFFLNQNVLSAKAGTLFSDDFEGYNYGDSPSNWYIVYKVPTIEIVSDPQGSNNKVLMLKAMLGWPARIERTAGPPDGDRVIEGDIYLTNNGNLNETKVAMLFFNGARVQFHNEEEGVLSAKFSDGSKDGSIIQRSWHHFVMYVDWDNSLYKFKIDGTVLYDGSFSKNDQNLWLAANDNESSRLVYLDNIVIYSDNINLSSPPEECAKFLENGDMSIPCLSLPYNNGHRKILLWVDLEYAGQNKNGDLIWKLKEFGQK